MESMAFAQVFAYQTNLDPRLIVAIVVVVVALIALRIFLRYLEQQTKLPPKASYIRKHNDAPPRPATAVDRADDIAEPDRKELKQLAEALALTSEQAQFMTRQCESFQIAHPMRLLNDPSYFGSIFDTMVNQIQSIRPPTRESERDKTMLFTIHEAVQNRSKAGVPIASTRQIARAQHVTLLMQNGEQYPTIVVENRDDCLVIATPRDNSGNELRFPILTKLTFFLTAASGQSYQFSTRVKRYESAKNATRIVAGHTNAVTAMPNRRHDRKAFKAPCAIARVDVANIVSGNRTERRFTPSKQTSQGEILDISAGGCSVETVNPLPPRAYLQIQFRLENLEEDTIIGKVIRLTGDGNRVMHIQFVKMPRATLNRIFMLVYNYGES